MRKMMITIAAIAISALSVNAGEKTGTPAYKPHDGCAAIRIKYNGSASTATVSNSLNKVMLVDDTVTTTAPMAESATLATLVGLMRVATNSAGTKNFQIEYVGGLAADVPSNAVLPAASINLADNKWHEILTWDTSAALHFDTVSYGEVSPDRWLSKIYGVPGGIGTVTVTAYIDGTEKYRHVKTSPDVPFMTNVVGSLTFNSNDVVNLDLNLGDGFTKGLMVPQKSRLLIRATRSVTATTGGIGGLITTE